MLDLPNILPHQRVASGQQCSPMTPAKALQNSTGYSPEIVLRCSPFRLPLSTVPSTAWCARGLQLHLRCNLINCALLAKHWRLRKGLPFPGSLWPQAQLSNFNAALPVANSRSVNSLTMSRFQLTQCGGCSNDQYRWCCR